LNVHFYISMLYYKYTAKSEVLVLHSRIWKNNLYSKKTAWKSIFSKFFSNLCPLCLVILLYEH